MNRTTTAALLALFGLSSAIAHAKPGPALEVTARVEDRDGGGIGIGQPFRLIIEAHHGPGSVALLPEALPFDGSKLAERTTSRRHSRAGDGEEEVDRYELEILAFEAGALEIPAIPLALGSTRAETRPLALEIATGFSESELPVATSTIPEALGELEKMAAQDPPPVEVLVPDRRPLYAAAALAAALLIGLVVWRLRATKRGAQTEEVAVKAPPRPAHLVARERLARLRAAGHLERGEKKAFFSELSEILREYAGARYGFDSLDLTVEELMLELTRARTIGLDHVKLKWILDRADMVKFAKFEVELAEAASAISDAEDLVERTRPREDLDDPSATATDLEGQHAS